MKRLTIGTLTLAAVCACAAIAMAQRNPRGNAKLTLNGQEVTVDYGRPSLKGRKVEELLGQVKAGGVWRLGADQSTTFTTGTDLDFGGVTVPKGTYSLWAQKEADNSWKLVFNTQHGQWGTSHDASKDLVAAPLKAENEGNAEQVTIKLEQENGGGEISIQWGNMELSANFKAK